MIEDRRSRGKTNGVVLPKSRQLVPMKRLWQRGDASRRVGADDLGSRLRPAGTIDWVIITWAAYASVTLLQSFILYALTDTWQMLLIGGGALLSFPLVVQAWHTLNTGHLKAAGNWLLSAVIVSFVSYELAWRGKSGQILLCGSFLLVVVGIAVVPRRWRVWVISAGVLAGAVGLVNWVAPFARADVRLTSAGRLPILPIWTGALAVIIGWQVLCTRRPQRNLSGSIANGVVSAAWMATAAALVFGAVFDFDHSERVAVRRLDEVAALREDTIRGWLQDVRSSLSSILDDQTLGWMLDLARNSPGSAEYELARNRLQPVLDERALSGSVFSDIFVIGADGWVLASTRDGDVGRSVAEQKFFLSGLEGFYVEPLCYLSWLDEVGTVVARPLWDGSGAFVGVLAATVNAHGLSDAVRQTDGLGESGDAYLVGQSGLLLTDPRFAHAAQPGATGDQCMSAVNQARSEGVEAGVLPRLGENTLDVCRWIPELNALLVVEELDSEVFVPVRTIVGLGAAGFLVSFLFAWGASTLLTRTITAPLEELAEAARGVAVGDLGRVARVDRQDELGDLGRAFNAMTAGLRDVIERLQAQVLEIRESGRELREEHANLRKYANRVSVLHEIDQGVLAAHSSADTLLAVVHHVGALFSSPYAGIVELDGEAGEARMLTGSTAMDSVGLTDSRIPLAEMPGWADFPKETPWLVDDVLAEARQSKLSWELVAQGSRSAIFAPLPAQDGVTRFLFVGSDRTGAFSSEDVDVAGEVATSMGLALHRAALVERVSTAEAVLKEKDVLFEDVHRQVNRSLLAVCNLLATQAERVKDPDALVMFVEDRDRLYSVVLAYEALANSDDLSQIDVGLYMRTLVSYLLRSYHASVSEASIFVDVADVRLGAARAIPCGLIVSELVSNGLKEALLEKQLRNIRVSMHEDYGVITLAVSDDGINVPLSFDMLQTDSPGLQLVTALVRQMEGSVTIDRSSGVEIRVKFRRR